MALNREEILSLDVKDELMEGYLIELMQIKHSSNVKAKQLEAALQANDELHMELERLKRANADTTEEAVEGEVVTPPEKPTRKR